jgi:thiamine-monophosphate kinase
MVGKIDDKVRSVDKEAFLIDQLSSAHIGDDGAVIGDTIYSMDAFCEGVHFRREWMTPAQIGRKAMLVNLSDAVAMNADPDYALVSVSVPRDCTEEAIAELVGAMEATAAEWGCEIIGGDTVGGERLHLAVTLISRSDAPLRRTGLRVGDLLGYTGALGESRRDLARLEAGESIPEGSRFFRPTLRREFVRKARPYLRAGMDISDGLFCDAGKLLALHGLGLRLDHPIPESVGASGEEYEMLFGCDPRHREAIEAVADSEGIEVTFIGQVAHNTDPLPCTSHHFG